MRIVRDHRQEGGGSETCIPDPPTFLGRIFRIVASPLIASQSIKNTLSTVWLRKKRLPLIYGITVKKTIRQITILRVDDV